MLRVISIGLVLMLSACGSTYTLKSGGWALENQGDRGTCLTVHGDGDPEVVVVCIAKPEPIKLPKSLLESACPKAVPAVEGTDGAE